MDDLKHLQPISRDVVLYLRARCNGEVLDTGRFAAMLQKTELAQKVNKLDGEMATLRDVLKRVGGLFKG